MPNLASWISSKTFHERLIADGGELFPRHDNLIFFLRKHRAELVKAGVLIPSSGKRATMLRADRFVVAAEKILDREARATLSDAA